tara:strand:- start:1582 stop:3927 length:2346 start_codon:yes stop_codon:yes gene_type:complete
MAIVITDTNDKRKQVDLKLGKVALTPTIQAQRGPTTQVQDISPIVKQGEQFLNNFNNLFKVYGDAVDVFTEQGKEEAKNLDEAGFQDALKNISGDSFSLFGKTKAFNEGLVERYFATEVPLALQKIDEEMQADITQYGSLDKFQEATAQRLDKYFDTLGEQFDENVFTNRALGAYSSVVKQKMLLSSNEKYLEKIDAFNTEEANNKAHREINSLTNAVEISHVVEGKSGLQRSLELIDAKNAEILTNPLERNKASTGAVFGKLENAIKSNDFETADAILDLIEDEEFSVNGKQIFNTAEAGLKVDSYRAAYDTAYTKYRRETLHDDKQRAVAETGITITSAIRNSGEDVGLELVEKGLDEIAETGSITIGETTYSEPEIVNEIQKELTAMKYNNKIFVSLYDDNLIKAASPELEAYTRSITSENQIKGLISETAELSGVDISNFFIQELDETTNKMVSVGISADLSDIINEVETFENELMQEIVESIPEDVTLYNEKVQYIKDQIKERDITGQLKQKLIDSIKSHAPQSDTIDSNTETQIADLDKQLVALGYEASVLEQEKETLGDEYYMTMSEVLKLEQAGVNPYNYSNGQIETQGVTYGGRYKSFNAAEDRFESPENKLQEHDELISKLNGKAWFGLGRQMANFADRYSWEIGRLGLNGNYDEKVKAHAKIAEVLGILGLGSDDLLRGHITGKKEAAGVGPQKFNIQNQFQNRGSQYNFEVIGIRLNGSYSKTVKAIEAFEADLTVDPTMQAIADKYGIDVSELYALQRKYFEQNGYLK